MAQVTKFLCFLGLIGVACGMTIDGFVNGTEGEPNDELPQTINAELLTLTADQLQTISTMRDRVQDLLTDEYKDSEEFLVRWLKAKNWRRFQAETFLKKAFGFRKLQGIDELGTSPVDEEMKERFPYRIEGRDKAGCPLFQMDLGKWDIEGFILEQDSFREGIEKFNKYQQQMWEKVMAEVRKRYTQCAQFTLLGDLTGFTLGNIGGPHSVNLMMKWMQTYESLYPEALRVAYLINVPQEFVDILVDVKPMMTPSTVSKFNIYSDQSEWAPVLKRAISQWQIPKRYEI